MLNNLTMNSDKLKVVNNLVMNSDKQVDKKSALMKHILETNHDIDFTDWKILAKDSSGLRLRIKESLAILALKPDLNSTTRSTPLIIFPDGIAKKKVKFKMKIV